MRLPEKIEEAIAKEISFFSLESLAEARRKLSSRYRLPIKELKNFMTTEEERCSYLITRLPATFAVVKRILRELPLGSFDTLLDLGSGPGTVLMAVLELFPQLKKATMVEKDPQLVSLGKRLVDYPAQWEGDDLLSYKHFKPHNLVTLSYSLGEIAPLSASSLLKAAWEATEEFLVIIEPGTPHGFQTIRAARTQLIELGGFLKAPCPHQNKCPILEGDWCHFAERVDRSSTHRKLKEGSLGYEDEKFSYVVFSKKPTSLPTARITRHPQKRSGHVLMTLCLQEGQIKETVISRRDGSTYKEAKKASWGETFYLP